MSTTDLPIAFARRMREMLGEDGYEAFALSLRESPPVSVRINPDKCAAMPMAGQTPVAWSSRGYYLDHRPDFTLDPLFHAGTYYVQEASSMFLEQALRVVGQPRTVLDLCAAPGGKSTLLRSLLPDEAVLVSNDPVGQRAQVLAENMIKWGHEGCLVTCGGAHDFGSLGALFDLIVVDAPCSGEGMFRKDNPARELWSEANVAMCAERQRDILRSVWPALKEGGYMVYSTCTYNTDEDERNVEYVCESLGAEAVAIPLDAGWQIRGNMAGCENMPVCRFFPHLTRGEGFFLALLRKTQGVRPSRIKIPRHVLPLSGEWKARLQKDDMMLHERNGLGYAVRSGDIAMTAFLAEAVRVLTCGIPLYEQKGPKKVPHHGLAMSRQLRKDWFPVIDLSENQALDYLRCMAMTIDAPRGYVLMTYRGVPLGFVNNLGSRANNMYPKAWRIRYC